MPKNAEKFSCEKCNFSCSKKSNYDKHLLTAKHQILTNTYTKAPVKCLTFECGCGKIYKHRQSLYAHKKKCTHVYIEKDTSDTDSDTEIPSQELELIEDNNVDYKNMFIQLMKQNQELQQTVVEQQKQYTETINEMIPKIGNTTNNTTNNNQQFNLQFFLNERCKDALNITDFMRSIELNMNDLIQTGKLGYVEGMSRIFVKALKDMDVTERPIHCTDIKRETVYIKDEDKWEKDDDEKSKMRKTIRNIENKNLKMLPKWQEENPEHRNLESKKSNEFMELSITALGGQDDKEKSEKKIMKNILKEVVVDK
tara:strand:+ start:191 stop:1123 length:933 start_codon:yes stop_codon:yes gene_type:complete